ncbi:MAG: hypothetical protein HQK89_02940 [Nitrospirae bacterium]|nr:hypothetical protein [Nitrospirota bacterium]
MEKDNHLMTYEYVNDFLFCVIKPYEERGDNVVVYCSGVNVSRFTPITAGKHRLGQNPAVKGLQSSNLDVRAFIIAHAAEPETIRGGDECSGFVTFSHQWNTETLAIKNAGSSFLSELIRFSVSNLLKIVLTSCLPGVLVPKPLPGPEELQDFLESLCKSPGK